jgi:hypothetical protein
MDKTVTECRLAPELGMIKSDNETTDMCEEVMDREGDRKQCPCRGQHSIEDGIDRFAVGEGVFDETAYHFIRAVGLPSVTRYEGWWMVGRSWGLEPYSTNE